MANGQGPASPGLVLTRKPGEVIYIGEDIVITLLETRAQQTKLHISAPRDVNVSRGEFGFESHMEFVRKRKAGSK